jgi:competence protein ComEA
MDKPLLTRLRSTVTLLLLSSLAVGVLTLTYQRTVQPQALEIVLPTATVQGAASTTPEPVSVQARGPLNLNTAGSEALESLPGIGPVIAGRIITWRSEHGPFLRVEDLLQVSGIGSKTLEELRPLVTVE